MNYLFLNANFTLSASGLFPLGRWTGIARRSWYLSNISKLLSNTWTTQREKGQIQENKAYITHFIHANVYLINWIQERPQKLNTAVVHITAQHGSLFIVDGVRCKFSLHFIFYSPLRLTKTVAAGNQCEKMITLFYIGQNTPRELHD